jgi:YaiO family outer membrane protein
MKYFKTLYIFGKFSIIIENIFIYKMTSKYISIIILLIVIFFSCFTQERFSQTSLSGDELFIKARDTAFKEDNYPAAREICKNILKRSPAYSDVSVFLGRLYTWDDYSDSARIVFDALLKRDSTVYDCYLAYIDLEYWADNYDKALIIAKNALKHFPDSEEMLMKKAKILAATKNYTEAFLTLETLFKINNTYNDAILFSERLKEEVRINAITITYDYDKFDKTFDSWHATSVAYSRRTPVGTVIGRVNYANRFKDNGWQYEMDAYPRFAEGLYSYLNAGYSKSSIFPKYRLGASLYYSLPYSFEIDAGIRYLVFSSSNVNIFTGALGKYYSNFWFSFRTFITPSISSASHSYSLIIRYYISGADDYLSCSLGTGISPDDRTDGSNLLISKKIFGEYQIKFDRQIIINLTSGFYREEYSDNNFRNRISFGVGIKTIF